MDIWPALLGAPLQIKSFIPAALAGAGTLIVMLQWYLRRNRQASPSTVVRAAVFESRSSNMPVDAARWQVDLHEHARDVQAQLDCRLAMLERLIREADERIAQLTELGAGDAVK